MRRQLAHMLRRIADRMDRPAPITIDLRNNMTHMDASKTTQRDIDRMYAVHGFFNCYR